MIQKENLGLYIYTYMCVWRWGGGGGGGGTAVTTGNVGLFFNMHVLKPNKLHHRV